MTRPTLAEVNRTETREERERQMKLHEAAYVDGAILGPVAAVASIAAISLGSATITRSEILGTGWRIGAGALTVVALTLIVLALRAAKRRKRARSAYDEYQTETINEHGMRMREAVRGAEEHYQVEGLEVDLVSFKVGETREVYVKRDGELIAVRAVFPAKDAPLTLLEGNRELAT